MKVFTLATELSDIHRENPNRKIAFIPTMGALHAGHLSLVKSAQQDGYLTVVSIFVNPLQFNNPEDLKKYPRTLDNDLALLSNQGVDVVFTPTTSEMYPANVEDVQIELGDLDQKFEGACRPGHFHGVVQVVYRLFNYVQPHVVYFGEKDLQQCLVIEQLVLQQFPSIEMKRVTTMREDSGLAMSSRNVRLSSNARKNAASIFQCLNAVIEQRLTHCKALIQQQERLKDMGFEVEYLTVVSLPFMNDVPCDFFQKPQSEKSPQMAVVFAGSIEGVRLIDNLVFS
ncbi:MAG: hypothetical protein RIR98_70 [Bacteroidota bacterium]|jgi:pantoate--beta-alanine ligase